MRSDSSTSQSPTRLRLRPGYIRKELVSTTELKDRHRPPSPFHPCLTRIKISVTMQFSSGRFLPAQQGGRHCCQPWHSLEDRISGLPEDLLLEILTRLRSTAEAACAGAVSRGWRDLWTMLPELTFSCIHPLSVESALTRITRPSLDLLDITLCAGGADEEDWSRPISLLLRGAARVLPQKLIISVLVSPIEEYTVELPCFEHTSYLSLVFIDSVTIVLPQSGEFTALKNLHLESCSIDIGSLLPLCPCLRILNIKDLKHADTVIVHSPLLEEFGLEVKDCDIHRIDIAAPVLKEVTLDVDIVESFSLSFSAPMVKKLKWVYCYECVDVVFGQIWDLVGVKESGLDDFYVASLIIISGDYGPTDAELSIAQVIAHLPVTDFSVLEVDLGTEGHAFGPLMLRLLQIRPAIQRLNMVLARNKVQVPCPVNCPCEQPSNWRSEDVSLANLELVEIHGLQGEDDEVDFLKLVLRCATMLRRLTVSISDDISPSNNGYKKICSTMKEYPGVEWNIVASGSEGVVYP